MELVDDGAFELRGFSPHSLTFLPTTNSLLATDRSGRVRCLDIVSGSELYSAVLRDPPVADDSPPLWDPPLPDESPPVLVTLHPSTSKVVVAGGRSLGARGALGGAVLLRTILQTPAASEVERVAIEIPVAQVPPLLKELQSLSPSLKAGPRVELLQSVVSQLEAGLLQEKTRPTSKFPEKSCRWSTLSFTGAVKALSELFDDLISRMKVPTKPLAAATPSQASPALPTVAAICLRLQLLRPDHDQLGKFEWGEEMTTSESKLMHCEALRRLSLAKWPHKDYRWAVPKPMAAAGFYHLSNPAAQALSKGDRVSCFACRVYLYSWEPTDEPWSEHERHAMQCPFMRGEPTENVPVAVTEGTHPARYCAAPGDHVTCISTSANCGLVGVATERGHISVWDIERGLYLMEHTSLDITVELLGQCITACESSREGTVVAETEREPARQLETEEGTPAAGEGSSTQTTQQQAAEPEAGGMTEAGALEEAAGDASDSDPPDELLVPAAMAASPPYKPDARGKPQTPSEISPLLESSELQSSQPCPKQSFHITALSVVAPSEDQAGSAAPGTHPTLVSAVTVISSGRTLPLLLVHGMKSAKAPEKTKSEPSKKFFPPPDDPLMDYMFDLDPLPQVSLGLGSQPLPPGPIVIPPSMLPFHSIPHPFAPPPPNIMLDVLGTGKSEETDSRLASVHLSCSILLRDFSSASQGPWPEIQHIVPLNGGWMLAVSVTCKRLDFGSDTAHSNLPHGGLLLYKVTKRDSGITVEAEPTKTIVFSSEEATIASMCTLVCTPDDGKREQPDLLAVATQGGSLVVYETPSLEEVAKHSPVGEDRFVTVAHCPSPSQLAAATRGGRVVLLSLRATEGEKEERQAQESEAELLGKAVLTQPMTAEELQQFTDITKTSSVGVPFSGTASHEWQSISLLQHHRRSPIHVHLPQEEGGASATQIWQHRPPSSSGEGANGKTSPQHLFELTPSQPTTPIGCVSVKLTFASSSCLSEKATASLLLPQRDPDAPPPQTVTTLPKAELLCGPLRLMPLVDVTGQSIQLSLCHSKLITGSRTVLWLLLEDLFPADYSDTIPEPSAAAPSLPPLRRRTAVIKHGMLYRRHFPTPPRSKPPSLPEQSTIVVTLYPLAVNRESSVRLLLQLYEKPEFVAQVVLAACGYVVEEMEHKSLPEVLQATVGTQPENSGGADARLKALELLSWMASLQCSDSNRHDPSVVSSVVCQLLVSLLHSCFIRGNRSLSHKCARLLIILSRSEKPSSVVDPFPLSMAQALCSLLPLLPLTPSGASLHWFLRLVALVARSHENHMTSSLCLTLLVELTKHLNSKMSLNSQILQTHFKQEGSVLEPELFDIYLSYCQKGTSQSQPRGGGGAIPFSQSSMQPPPPPMPPGGVNWQQYLPPTNSNYNNTSTTGTHIIADKRSHTIYDSELQLLLNCSEKTEQQASKAIEDYTTFKHGSFLLYGQRGLLETHPLEYSCISVSGNATVQESSSHAAAATSDGIPTPSHAAESTKTTGYHFPTTQEKKPASRISFETQPGSTSQPVPASLSNILVIPRELVMHIESLKSGTAYSAVLRLSHPVFLTDLSIPATNCMYSVSVEVWLKDNREAVRVAHSSEIRDRSLMIGNLMPPPLCQFIKVTFVGKLGASREKAQVLVGSFFARPQLLPSQPLPPMVLYSLEQQLLSQYLASRERLSSALTAYVVVTQRSLGGTAAVRQSEDHVSACYRNCFKTQVKLSRLRNFMRHHGGSDQQTKNGVLCLGEQARLLDLSEMSSSRLYKFVGCLVDTLLVLSDQQYSEEDPSKAGFPEEAIQVFERQQTLPPMSEEDCYLLFSVLCIHGVPKLHARACGLLIRLCGSQPWWGRLITSTAIELFSSRQTAVFDKERALLQLSALCQRTYQVSDAIQCLFQVLDEKLSPLETGLEGNPPRIAADQQLLQWLVLLFSHILASLSRHNQPNQSQNLSNLFVPVLTLPPSASKETSTEEGSGEKEGAPADPVVELSERKKEIRRMLADMQQKIFSLSGEEKLAYRAKYDSLLNEYRDQRRLMSQRRQLREAQDEPPVPLSGAAMILEPDPVLSSLSLPLCLSVARGLACYVLVLTTSQSWDFIPVACKALSQLVALNSQRLPLHSLLSQKQLDFLIAFCCHRCTPPPVGKGGCGQGWGQRAVECLLINLLYHGEIADLIVGVEVGGANGEAPGSFDREAPTQDLKSEESAKENPNADSGDTARKSENEHTPTASEGEVLVAVEEKSGSGASMKGTVIATGSDKDKPTDSHSETSEDTVTAEETDSSSCDETGNQNQESQSGIEPASSQNQDSQSGTEPTSNQNQESQSGIEPASSQNQDSQSGTEPTSNQNQESQSGIEPASSQNQDSQSGTEPTSNQNQESQSGIEPASSQNQDSQSGTEPTSNQNQESQSGIESDTAAAKPQEYDSMSNAPPAGEEGHVTMEPEGKQTTPEAEPISCGTLTEQELQPQSEQQQTDLPYLDLPYLPPVLAVKPLKMTVQSSAELAQVVEQIKHLAQHHTPGSSVKAVINWVGPATPEEKPKPTSKKKLSKQMGSVFKKFAPGDYSDIPVYRPTVGGDGGSGGSNSTLPYQSFIISNTVDSRLLCNTEFPAELELQCVAKKVYEAVLVALLNTRPNLPDPSLHPPFLEAMEDVQERHEHRVGMSTAMLCQSIEGLLVKCLQPQADIDIIAVLEMWSQLNSLAPRREQDEKSVADRESTAEVARSPTVPHDIGLPILSRKAVTLLQENLLSEHFQSAKTWQLGVTLLHTAVREREANPTSPRHHELLGDVVTLSKVLVKLFSSGEKFWSSSATQSSVLVKFLEGLVPVKMPAAWEEGWRGVEDLRGVHMLLWVVVTVLEKSGAGALESPPLMHLMETLGQESTLGLLWSHTPSPCTPTLDLLRQLCVASVSILQSFLSEPQHSGVLLYGAELEEERRRYRYLSSSVGHEVKWVQLQLERSNTRRKLASELLQLLRRMLIARLPDSARIPLQMFCRSHFEGDETLPDSERNHLELADSSMPLLALIYTNKSLLTQLLKLLNASTNSSTTEEKFQLVPTKGSAAIPPNLVEKLFCNFIHFLDLQCRDHSCFFQPILEVLESQGEELQASREFMSLVGRLTAEFRKEDNWDKVVRFIQQGGAKLIFECLISACKHTQPSPGPPLLKSITKLGQKDTPKLFRENMSLINFLPLASIKLSPNRTPVRDLRSSGLSDHPSRSSTFHHTYHTNEDWLKMTISLPYPILLHALQLFQPLGLVQNGPSAILLETACQSSLSPATPLTPLLPTSGLSCIKLELQPPVVVQEVVLHLFRPRVADSISLSHMHLLGVGYGGGTTKKEQKPLSPDRPHPSTGWLEIVNQWLDLPDNVKQQLVEVATAMPELLSSCLSLLTSQEALSPQSSTQLERLLVAIATQSPEQGLAMVQHLLGLQSSLLIGGTTSTSSLVAIELLHSLCLPGNDSGSQRLFLTLRLFSQFSNSRLPTPPSLPALIRAVSSAVWQATDTPLQDEELFRSLVEAAFSQEVGSPLKLAMGSLLCALCRHNTHLFSLVLDSCQQAVREGEERQAELLQTLALAAKSEECTAELLKSELATGMVRELEEGFTGLVGSAGERAEDDGENVRTFLSKACMQLAFLTDFCRNWPPAKDWLGMINNCSMWSPLVEVLSLIDSRGVSATEITFCQKVACEFFQACLCGHLPNTVMFIRLLCHGIRGFYTFERLLEPDKNAPLLTPFLYRLVVEIVLKTETLHVILRDDSKPNSPLSLTPTHECPHFHPSFPIGQQCYHLQVPASSSIEEVQQLCLSHQPQPTTGKAAKEGLASRKLPAANPPSNKLEIAKFNLRKMNLFEEKGSQTVGNKTAADQKSSQGVFFAHPSNPSSEIPPNTVISRLMHLESQKPAMSLLLRPRPSPPTSEETKESPLDIDEDPVPSFLELFIRGDGHQPLARCLPALYPYHWPEKLSHNQGAPQQPGTKAHSLLHTPMSLPLHSTVMLGLGLRLDCYGSLLRQNSKVAYTLMKLLLGAELKDPFPKATLEQLSFLPYLLLLQCLREHPVASEEGMVLREQVLEAGMAHQTLHCLSLSGHHPSRVGREDPTTAEPGAAAGPHPLRVTSTATDRHYWAKGTGFGTGSTTSAWNMEATIARQRQEEKYVSLCFAILSEYLACPAEAPHPPTHCPPYLVELLAASCLLPALAAYLVNDSVLDISKHVELYQSMLALLSSLASNPSLRYLLVLPVYSEKDVASGDDITLASLVAKLRGISHTFQRTFKAIPTDSQLKEKQEQQDPSAPPLLPRQPKLPGPIHPTSPDDTDLVELVGKVLETAEGVAAAVEEGREGVEQETELTRQESVEGSSSDIYMKAMKPLQFDTYKFLEEDESGHVRFLIPFHYESRVQSAASSAAHGAARARRLAQEVTTLATSLPLSPSSSVFVRCDEERLDIMKVMITGPSDTPYANGCFELDVFFPPEYPKSPMLVNLMTTGQGRVRFNPNLYNDGKVCLSVLNTWHGRPEEKWNSQTSSFLQVLVSIQSLILVPEPYFNEPGYEQYRGTPYGDQKSLTYSANIQVATVQWAMINQLRNPSPCFKEVILQHFYLHQAEVLSQCEQWKRELVDGIAALQEMGVSVAHLKEQLRTLIKVVDTLRVELGKVKPSDFQKSKSTKESDADDSNSS